MVRNRSLARNGNRHQTVFRRVHGAAGAFEFKRGSGSGLWHPHIHLFALVRSDVDLLEMEWDMSDEWRKLTRDSHNVDATPIDWTTEESRMKAVCEVFRYALKFGEMEIEDQVHAYKVLSGKRLVRDFGSLHGVKVPEDTADTIEEELALKPYMDLVYEYSKGKGYFLKEITDTKDQLTGQARPKSTGGEKASRRLSSKLFLPVKDLSKPWRKRPLDQSYMDEWTEKAGIERTVLEEAPF